MEKCDNCNETAYLRALLKMYTVRHVAKFAELEEKIHRLEIKVDGNDVPHTPITRTDREVAALRIRCDDLETSGRRLASQLQEKDHELAQKEAKIRELEGLLHRVPEKKPTCNEAMRRTFSALMGFCIDNDMEDTQ